MIANLAAVPALAYYGEVAAAILFYVSAVYIYIHLIRLCTKAETDFKNYAREGRAYKKAHES